MSARIRQATFGDEDALYNVCLRTGDSGQDASAMYDDPRALGHIYAGPYLRLEPALAFVLEDDEGVAGYVLGALDSNAFYERFMREWLPPLRATHPDPSGDSSTWTPAQRCYHVYHHFKPFVPQPETDYPSHLHIDILPRAQGRGHGQAMLEALFARLRAGGSSGVHLGVGEGNTRATGFYRKIGFHELLRLPDCLYMGLRLRDIIP